MEKLTTATMKLNYLFENWRPGSYDWSWDEEFADIMSQARTEPVRKRVESEGIGFADSFAPVLLGSDGRVWDGHHRICLARELGINEIEVELA
jgi:hypothetical protein